MSTSTLEEYTRSLPSSRWLRDMLEYGKESCEGCLTDKKWQKAHKYTSDDLKPQKIGFEMSTKILEQSIREPKKGDFIVRKL